MGESQAVISSASKDDSDGVCLSLNLNEKYLGCFTDVECGKK